MPEDKSSPFATDRAFYKKVASEKPVVNKADQHFMPGETRDQFLKRIGASSTPERKINMQSGMGKTDAKKVYAEKSTPASSLLTNNPLEFIKNNPGKMNDALGYGTSLLTRGLAKGNTGMVKSDYVERLKGSDVFRKLDSASQGHVLKAYQQWLNSQSAFNEGKRKQMEVDKNFNRTFGQASDGLS